MYNINKLSYYDIHPFPFSLLKKVLFFYFHPFMDKLTVTLLPSNLHAPPVIADFGMAP